MLKQHQVDKFYGSLVYAVHTTRASIAQSPLMGYALLAGVSITVIPVVQPYLAPIVQEIAASEMALQTQMSIRASLNAVEAGLRSRAPEPEADLTGLGLNREQLRVASYAASKYRVALSDVQRYVGLAFEKAAQQRVDPMLVLAVMAVESNFRPSAQSHVGAQGLMQVHLVAHKEKFEPFGGKHMAFDPSINIHVGVQILKEYLRRTSSNEMALKYYVGAANHDNDGGYAYKVLSERERILAAAAGRSVPTIPLKAPDWLLAKLQTPIKATTGEAATAEVNGAIVRAGATSRGTEGSEKIDDHHGVTHTESATAKVIQQRDAPLRDVSGTPGRDAAQPARDVTHPSQEAPVQPALENRAKDSGRDSLKDSPAAGESVKVSFSEK
jgi:soluble lytic murein transglycosylase-like protein